MTRNEYAPVLICRREITELEKIRDHVSAFPGMVQQWAVLSTLIGAANRAQDEADENESRIAKMREETTNAPTGEG